MLWRHRATLIKTEESPDGEGYQDTKETRREVFVNQKSVARSEFYAAKRAGTRLAVTLEVHGVDYEGETLLEFEGVRYKVERPYSRSGEIIELNCKQDTEPETTEEDSEGEEAEE